VRRAAETPRRRREQARSAETEAVDASRDATRAIVELGFSRRDAAEVLAWLRLCACYCVTTMVIT
jgi:hypothetical protein